MDAASFLITSRQTNVLKREINCLKRYVGPPSHLSRAPWAGVLVLSLDDGSVQELECVGPAQVVRLAAVALVVARTANNLA